MQQIKLSQLKAGQSAQVLTVGGSGELRQHFLDMGIIPGTPVTLVKFAPLGDPMEFKLRGYELTLRLADAAQIEGKLLSDKELRELTEQEAAAVPPEDLIDVDHPGLGEGGRYHICQGPGEHPAGPDEVITFALAGNQNCGKTTLFNQLTGANQHVGNFPGVTVDKKSGVVRGYPLSEITDLPGIYSLSPYTSEEIVTREFLLQEKPRGIIDIVDATNIERNLYLTLQLMELDRPMVLALNMMDELTGNGGAVRLNEMEAMLGIPVVPVSAVKNQGVSELIRHAMHVARNDEKPGRTDFCEETGIRAPVHRCIHAIMHLIEDHAERAGLPRRFAATKLVEGDKFISRALKLTQNEHETIEHIIVQMEQERGLDRAAAIADMRFAFIQKLVQATVVKPHESAEHRRSVRIDTILTGRYTALPAFFAIMAVVFYLTFNVIGAFFQEILAACIDYAGDLCLKLMQHYDINTGIQSFVSDAIFGGVGSVLSFVPTIVTLFFFLSLLEDTGYMARIAFVMDKLLRKIGLSGRSIVPMLVGFGCTVPAVMASRTLPSVRDRRLTVLLLPFMSCSAKLPVYGFLTAAFFPGHGALVMIVLYVLGILLGVATGAVLQRLRFKGEAVPFVMELPNYRMPGLVNVARLLWDKARDFLQRAFTVIFVATIVVWFLQNFSLQLDYVTSAQDSILAKFAGFIAPVFAPAGFADWRVVTAIISGFMAKETIVATLGMLLDSAALTTVLSASGAFALLIFCLLYTPCVAAMATIRRELGTRWAIYVALWQLGLAWLAAVVCYQLLSAL